MANVHTKLYSRFIILVSPRRRVLGYHTTIPYYRSRLEMDILILVVTKRKQKKNTSPSAMVRLATPSIRRLAFLPKQNRPCHQAKKPSGPQRRKRENREHPRQRQCGQGGAAASSSIPLNKPPVLLQRLAQSCSRGVRRQQLLPPSSAMHAEDGRWCYLGQGFFPLFSVD